MSYQFDDDSALEELLNQQLDRRRQQTQTLSGRATSSINRQFRPSSSKINDAKAERSNNSPSQQTNDQSVLPQGKMATWLDGKQSLSIPADTNDQLPDRGASNSSQKPNKLQLPGSRNLSHPGLPGQETTSLADLKKPIDLLIGDPEKLQEMSKQRLIQFILEEIQPSIRDFVESSDMKLKQELNKIKEEFEEDRDRHSSREKQQIELIELKWQNLNKQLEGRLEVSETELRQVREAQRSLIDELTGEFRKQMAHLAENYQVRLDEEKRNGDERLKRSQDLGRLELESKLKVNMELDKLEVVFDGWQQMVRTTIDRLDQQMRSVEGSLEKQTLAINATNVDLTKKSHQLSEQFARFETQTGLLEDLSSQLSRQTLPQLFIAQKESQLAIDKISMHLQLMSKQTESIEQTKTELETTKRKLEVDKEELSKEKFQVQLELSRLELKEEKLNDLLERNGKIQSELDEQKASQRQQETKLYTLESNLEQRSKRLDEQNHELHLLRKRLASKEDDLSRLDSRLNEKSANLDKEAKILIEDRRHLVGLRKKIKQESNQLCRLQKSLICSLCFGRLFDVEQTGKIEQPSWMNFENMTNKLDHHLFPRYDGSMKNNTSVKEDLTNFSDYLEADAKQLETESKYASMLPN